MRRRMTLPAALGILFAACSGSRGATAIETPYVTTAGAIAIANLDQQIAQRGNASGVEELLLVRSRFLGDYDALDRASTIAEARFETAADLMRRARARSAVHRFADALRDVNAAERAGAPGDECESLRASILVATGHASDVVPQLEAAVARHAGFASRSALAGAYGAIGRLEDADASYVAALGNLDTTLPFPFAWIYFARGMMWTEQGRDSTRGAALYAQALSHLPEFATANIHLAEIEVGRGELDSAMKRLERVVASSNEPEARALLGVLHVRTGDPARGWQEVSLARQRFEALLARHPLAFADHAAEFYIGPGADAERAWTFAQQNLANRETPRALALAIKAARAAGREADARALVARAAADSNRSALVARVGSMSSANHVQDARTVGLARRAQPLLY
ncbi:MAG: tetratricopeptide repeat protein [bacterium]